MNQPTEDRLKHLEEEQRQLKEEVRKIKEQQTEPIKITRMEIEMHGARADILQIRESQADLRDRLIEHGSRLSSIETKQDAHTEVLGKLVDLGEETKASQAEQGAKLDLILKLLQKGE